MTAARTPAYSPPKSAYSTPKSAFPPLYNPNNPNNPNNMPPSYNSVLADNRTAPPPYNNSRSNSSNARSSSSNASSSSIRIRRV
jgi:hypothetical protein